MPVLKNSAQVVGSKAVERFRRWKRRGAIVAVGSLAFAVGYGVIFGHNGLTAFVNKRAEEKSLIAQRIELEKENERLAGHAERLQDDPGAIEHEAREELHYTRADEVIVTLPAAKPSTEAVPPADQ